MKQCLKQYLKPDMTSSGLAMLLALASLNTSASWQPALTAIEEARAAQIALESLDQQTQRLRTPGDSLTPSKSVSATTGMFSNTESTAGMNTTEILLIETLEQKNAPKPGERLVEVFLFSYPLRSTLLQVVNLETGAQSAVRTIDSLHLPLNENERRFARERIDADGDVSQAINSEYMRQFGKTIQDLSELDMKISVWQPTHPTGTDPAQQICHTERCALISLFTDEYFNFSLEPVVNLMTGDVYFIQSQ